MKTKEERVALALDALENLKYMKVARNRYINLVHAELLTTPLREAFEMGTTCRVCAFGALVVTHFLRENVPCYNVPTCPDEVQKKMVEYFGAYQAALIETAFEGT